MHFLKVLLIVASFLALAHGMEISNRIINGVQSEKPHPWVARILEQLVETPNGPDIVSNCGGSLIAPKWVLTAKHCVMNQNGNISSEEFHVSVGNNNYVKGRFIRVTKLYLYSRKNNIDNDIALLYLEKEADGIKPIPIQLEDFDYSGLTTKIYGWGRTVRDDPRSSPQDLRETEVLLKNKTDCPEDVVCFNPESTGTNSCEGDSGGPMTASIDGVETLIGVTHVGSVVDDIPCSGQFSSYVQTFYSKYAKWIKRVMKKHAH